MFRTIGGERDLAGGDAEALVVVDEGSGGSGGQSDGRKAARLRKVHLGCALTASVQRASGEDGGMRLRRVAGAARRGVPSRD